MILAGARQAGHDQRLANRVVKSRIIRVTVFFAKVKESAVLAGKFAWSVQASLVDAVLREERDVIEQFPLIVTNSAPRVGLGEKRQQIASRRLARGKHGSPRVVAVDQEKRDLVVTNQIGYLLASLKRRAHSPEQFSRHNFAAF